MLALLLLAWLVAFQAPQAAWMHVDISMLKASSPTVVTEIDTGKLKGEPRRLAWAPGEQLLYLQTAEGNPPLLTFHHYTIAVSGGTVTPVDAEPAWASEYWAFKQDRNAPGLPSLVIDVDQKDETIKTGTGPAGVLDRESSPEKVAAGGISPDNLAKGAHGDQKAHVVRLRLLGEDVGVWVNEYANPGAKFGWGPSGSGALVHVDANGGLVFFDEHKHRQAVATVKNALLPAWSTDGARLAFLQKTGRKTYAVAWMGVTLR
jgi:hypothetical protein